MKLTCLENPRPSAHVWEPLEYSLQALDRDSSLPLPLPLLRGHVRLSRLGHLPAGIPAFPFLWMSWKINCYVINKHNLSKHNKEMHFRLYNYYENSAVKDKVSIAGLHWHSIGNKINIHRIYNLIYQYNKYCNYRSHLHQWTQRLFLHLILDIIFTRFSLQSERQTQPKRMPHGSPFVSVTDLRESICWIHSCLFATKG